jgi:hypothetical protein
MMGRLRRFLKNTTTKGCNSVAQILITTLIAASMPPDARSQRAPRTEMELSVRNAWVPLDISAGSFA